MAPKNTLQSMSYGISARRSRRRAAIAVSVPPEARQHMVMALAYFRAAQFRAVGADGCRSDDLRDAQKRLDTVLKCYCEQP